MSKKVTGQIIVELLDRFPNAYTHTLANKAVDDNPGVFNSRDHARSVIRYYRGALGDKERNKLSDKKHLRLFDPQMMNPYKLPESDADDYPPYIIKAKRILVLPDIHVPYHDITAITVALNEGKKHNVDAVLLNGDFFDFHGGSRFVKDPRLRNMADEIEIGCELIKAIRNALGCPIYFKKGNHDERYEMYLKVHAPQIFGMPEFELNNIINGRLDFVVETIHRQVVYLGILPLIHGHEYGGYGGGNAVNAARWLFNKTKKCAMTAHSHRHSSNTTKDISGEIITTWSQGCLCSLHPEYAQLNEWTHGFSIVEVDDEGQFNVYNHRINNGKLYM